MKDKIAKILSLSYEISTKTPHGVFVDHSPHAGTIDVTIRRGGCGGCKCCKCGASLGCNDNINGTAYLDNTDLLDQHIAELEQILKDSL